MFNKRPLTNFINSELMPKENENGLCFLLCLFENIFSKGVFLKGLLFTNQQDGKTTIKMWPFLRVSILPRYVKVYGILLECK